MVNLRPIYRLIIFLTLFPLVSACASGGAAYWIPPSSPPTQPAAVAFLSETAVAVLEAQPTQESPDPGPTSDAPPEGAPTQVDPQEQPLEPTSPAAPTATPQIAVVNSAPILYYAQAADTLPVVAKRFGVAPNEIASPNPIPETGFINPEQLLLIPRRLGNVTTSRHLMPDSEVVYSPSAVGFDASEFANQAGGYLRSYREWHKSTGMKSGPEIVIRVAIENSINPRLLLGLLEYHSGWVYGTPKTDKEKNYPLGLVNLRDDGLYNQLIWTINQLSIGYYAYREGRFTDIRFSDGVSANLAPDLNAGTAALQYYFAQLYDSEQWLEALDEETGFPALHDSMFGDARLRALAVKPLFHPGITQPPLTLPFGRNWTWSYTGGPHGAWERDGAYAALDFAPGTVEHGCHESNQWATAAADGLVVRTGPGLVVLDLDGDGHEQTGWVLVYLHVESRDRIELGSWVATGDQLGHPSCEGGYSTGTHLHIARKYNGEWVPADGPLPFNLGGWVASAGTEAYKGTLTRDGEVLVACTCSNYKTFITRTDDDP